MENKDIVLEENKEEKTTVSKNFIEMIIDKDLAEGTYDHVQTRFPPEPNGYLHIGHAKSILLNSGLAKEYNGKFNLRFDDTNPTKEKTEFVKSITEDVKWLGADFEDRLFFASDYFDQMAEQYGWTESDNIYVTGHSKGGNKAQYVTLMSNHANLVDECHSFDGQGFSDEAIQSFKEKYGEEGYQEVLKKMYGYNGANDYVNPLGNTIIPKENIKYIDTVPNPGSGFDKFAGLHMEEQMFQRDENGNAIAVLGEETEQGVMGKFSAFLSEFLMSLPPEERDAAAMFVMQIMELRDVGEGGGALGVDGTSLTSGDIYLFIERVLPKLLDAMLEEVLEKFGLDKEAAERLILLVKLWMIFAARRT